MEINNRGMRIGSHILFNFPEIEDFEWWDLIDNIKAIVRFVEDIIFEEGEGRQLLEGGQRVNVREIFESIIDQHQGLQRKWIINRKMRRNIKHEKKGKQE